MASEIDICTSALLMVGANSINSFQDESREARVCAAIYETTRDDLLTRHPWSFALGQQQLSQLVTTPLFGYAYAYQLPTEPLCLRVQGIDGNYEYRVFEDKLYTDRTSVNILYIFQAPESEFKPYFTRALELELAAILSIALTEDGAKSDRFGNMAQMQLRKARNTDSQQSTPGKISDENFLLTEVRY